MTKTNLINKENVIEKAGEAVIETVEVVKRLNKESAADYSNLDKNIDLEINNLKELQKTAKTNEDKISFGEKLKEANQRKENIVAKKEHTRCKHAYCTGLGSATPFAVLLGIFLFRKLFR